MTPQLNTKIRLYLKEKFYKKYEDELCTLNRGELVHFLDQFKDRLKEIIKTIPEGNQGLLKVDDIVDVDHGFHHREASRELLYFSNPLYTLLTFWSLTVSKNFASSPLNPSNN